MTEEFEEATMVHPTPDINSQDTRLANVKNAAKVIRSLLQVTQGSLLLMGSVNNTGLTPDMIKDSIALAISEIETKILAS